MTNPRKTVGLTLLAVLGIVLLCLTLRPREPVYQGKRLSAWLRELDSWPGKSSEPATKAIREIGTNALPYLVTAIQAEDSPLKVKLAEILGRQRLVHFRFRLAEEKRDTAYKALLILRSQARNAIPGIGRMFTDASDGETLASAGMALFAIGGDSIPTLVEACRHNDQNVRAEAAFILCKLTPTGQRGFTTTDYPPGGAKPVSRFTLTLGDDDITALCANLSDPRAAVRRASAEALQQHPDIAMPAVPALRKALDDPDPGVREAAAGTLQAINTASATRPQPRRAPR